MMEDRELTDQIWKALSREDGFKDLSPAMREVFRPFTTDIPKIYAKRLDEPLTIELVFWARLVFLRYCVSNNFAAAATAAMPDDELGQMSREEIAEKLQNELVKAESRMARSIERGVDGVSEKEFMEGPTMSLGRKTRKLYKHGRLTLRELLMRQPRIIMREG